MVLNRLIRKLTRWAIILHEYDFDVVHRVGKVNWDVNGLNWKPSSSKKDTIKVYWHGDVDLKVVSRWHASTCLCILLGCSRDAPQARLGHGDSQEKRYWTKKQWCFGYTWWFTCYCIFASKWNYGWIDPQGVGSSCS